MKLKKLIFIATTMVATSLSTSLAEESSSLSFIEKRKVATQQTQAINSFRMLHIALMSYAMDNEGMFPASLEELEEKGHIEELAELTPFKVGKKEYNIIYVTGLSTSSRMSKVLLHSEKMESGKYVVTKLDGSTQLMDEAAYKKQLER